MSGLQEIAAVIGIADAAFRSICSLYDYARDLKNAPKEIKTILNETSTLRLCLEELRILNSADEEVQATVRRIGLRRAVVDCGDACAEIHIYLEKWVGAKTETLKARIHYRRHKKAIESAIDEIVIAKQTTILALLIVQLAIQLKKSSSNAERSKLVHESQEKIKEMAGRAQHQPSLSSDTRAMSRDNVSRRHGEITAMIVRDVENMGNNVMDPEQQPPHQLSIRFTQANVPAPQTSWTSGIVNPSGTQPSFSDPQLPESGAPRADEERQQQLLVQRRSEDRSGKGPEDNAGENAEDSADENSEDARGLPTVTQDWEGVDVGLFANRVGIINTVVGKMNLKQKWKNQKIGAREVGIVNSNFDPRNFQDEISKDSRGGSSRHDRSGGSQLPQGGKSR